MYVNDNGKFPLRATLDWSGSSKYHGHIDTSKKSV